MRPPWSSNRWTATTRRHAGAHARCEIPTVENGGVAADLKSITWKLKPDLKWSDGSAQ